jgi:hypothetical protein
MTHIKANAVMSPELALLVQGERIFSGKTFMDRVISFNDNKIIIALTRSARPSKCT